MRGPGAYPRREIVTMGIGLWVPGRHINLTANLNDVICYYTSLYGRHHTSSKRSIQGLSESCREIVAGRNGKILPAAVLIPRPITGGAEVGPPGGNFRYWSPPYVGIVQNIMGPGSFPS